MKTAAYRFLLLAGFVAAVLLGAYSTSYFREPTEVSRQWLNEPGPIALRLAQGRLH